jgi:hypothetical protein
VVCVVFTNGTVGLFLFGLTLDAGVAGKHRAEGKVVSAGRKLEVALAA